MPKTSNSVVVLSFKDASSSQNQWKNVKGVLGDQPNITHLYEHDITLFFAINLSMCDGLLNYSYICAEGYILHVSVHLLQCSFEQFTRIKFRFFCWIRQSEEHKMFLRCFDIKFIITKYNKYWHMINRMLKTLNSSFEIFSDTNLFPRNTIVVFENPATIYDYS